MQSTFAQNVLLVLAFTLKLKTQIFNKLDKIIWSDSFFLKVNFIIDLAFSFMRVLNLS